MEVHDISMSVQTDLSINFCCHYNINVHTYHSNSYSATMLSYLSYQVFSSLFSIKYYVHVHIMCAYILYYSEMYVGYRHCPSNQHDDGVFYLDRSLMSYGTSDH